MDYKIISKNELKHYGVKGMKWGVRHDKGSLGGRYNRRKANAIRNDINSFKGHENGIKTRSGKTVLSKKEVKNITSTLKNQADMYDAKADYKDAKKKYNKDFNNWYNKGISAYSPVKKHRQNNSIRYQRALVSAGELAIKKGQYLQAKGKLKNNQKAITKGKKLVKQATIAKNYNTHVLNELNSGKSWKEATSTNNSAYKVAEKEYKSIKK